MGYPSNVIQRPPARRSGCTAAGCILALAALLAVITVAVLLVLPNLPLIAARLAGLEPAGSTVDQFTNSAPVPTIEIQNARSASNVTINAPQVGSVNLEPLGFTIGQASTGADVATATYSESQLNTLCRERSPICTTGDGRIRNASIDLRPGGAIVRGEVLVPQLNAWQQVGVVLKTGSTSLRLEVAGVDMNGQFFALPEGEIGDAARRIADAANDALAQATANVDGSILQLREIYADDQQVLAVFR